MCIDPDPGGYALASPVLVVNFPLFPTDFPLCMRQPTKCPRAHCDQLQSGIPRMYIHSFIHSFIQLSNQGGPPSILFSVLSFLLLLFVF